MGLNARVIDRFLKKLNNIYLTFFEESVTLVQIAQLLLFEKAFEQVGGEPIPKLTFLTIQSIPKPISATVSFQIQFEKPLSD